eukprot:2418266-Alexandrium_andersonii.AAC.1
MASVRPHSTRKFLTTEVAWPVSVFPGRSAAVDSPVVASMPARNDGDVVVGEELWEGEVELNYRQ